MVLRRPRRPPCPPVQPGEEAQGSAKARAVGLALLVASGEWTHYLWL